MTSFTPSTTCVCDMVLGSTLVSERWILLIRVRVPIQRLLLSVVVKSGAVVGSGLALIKLSISCASLSSLELEDAETLMLANHSRESLEESSNTGVTCPGS